MTTDLQSQLAIAHNKAAFDAALFTGPRTFDGYIIRLVKGGIKLFIRGETFVLNHDNVFCLQTKQPDRKMWYSYGGEFKRGMTLTQEADLASQIRALALVRANKA